MKKFFILCLFICTAMASSAQERSSSRWIWGPSIGYQYQNGNFLKASGWGLFAPNDEQFLRIDAGANFIWIGSGATVVPELGLTYYLSDKALWPFIKGEITPHTVSPKAGISVFSLIDMGVGYGFDINTKNSLGPIDGLTFSIDIKIPLRFHL